LKDKFLIVFEMCRQKGEKIFQKLKTVWKVEEKEGGGDASCEKTAEAANREHQTN